MPTTTLRISTQTRETLRQLAAASGLSIQRILDDALDLYQRQRLLEQGNAAYAALRQDAAVWAEMERERQEWDATLADGL